MQHFLAFSLLMNKIVTAEIVMMIARQRARSPVHIPWSNNTSTASMFHSGTRSKWSQVQFLIKTTVNLVCDTHTLLRTHSQMITHTCLLSVSIFEIFLPHSIVFFFFFLASHFYKQYSYVSKL